jgi:hypothetical protein
MLMGGGGGGGEGAGRGGERERERERERDLSIDLLELMHKKALNRRRLFPSPQFPTIIQSRC